jgi:mono/diheme cytochrome c family protein
MLLAALAAPAAPAPVSFSRELAPLLEKKCVACHGAEKAKGGFRLHTFSNLLQGGDSKEPIVTAGRPEQSKLHQLLVATDPDDRMPQKDEPLPSNQIELLKRWILEGAAFDGPDPKVTLASLRANVPHPAPPAAYAHPVPVAALAFAPDGRTLAAGGRHEVTLWDPRNGTLLGRYTNLDQQTLALAYSPNGELLAAGGGTPGRSGQLKLIETGLGTVRPSLVSLNDLVLSAAFSPDGRLLASGSADNTIRLFDVATGAEVRRVEPHADWVTSVAFISDGKRLASASRDKTARILEVETGEMEETYSGHSQPLFALAVGPDAQSVISAGRDKAIHIWQIKEAKKVFEIGGLEPDIMRILVQSNTLFACGTDRLIRQYRLQLPEKKAELVRTYSGHLDCVYGLAWHEPSACLATSDYRGEVRVWNSDDGTLRQVFRAAPGYQVERGPSGGPPSDSKTNQGAGP